MLSKKIIPALAIGGALVALGNFQQPYRAEEYITEVVEADSTRQDKIADAASFAIDWLVALDNNDYAGAAVSYQFGENPHENAAMLENLRSPLGTYTARNYAGSVITAIANDDSEYKIQVRYLTEFPHKTVTETIDVLLWPNDPVVLLYAIE